MPKVYSREFIEQNKDRILKATAVNAREIKQAGSLNMLKDAVDGASNESQVDGESETTNQEKAVI